MEATAIAAAQRQAPQGACAQTPPTAAADATDVAICVADGARRRTESGVPRLPTLMASLISGGGLSQAESSPASARSVEASAGRDHRSSARVHGVDDLGVVDAFQVHRRDPEVRVAQLSLDDVQRHALSGHLDRVRVTQPMRCEAPPHTGTCRGTSQLLASVARGQRTAARAAVDDAEQCADRKFEPQRQPWTELLSAPLVRRRADER
ncbi:MAG: hypothetical protein QOJ85_3863 [Solirubrobacteraceae bacterium]|nr:hypothetical protein [Solirubrobacteraceae bacterium]